MLAHSSDRSSSVLVSLILASHITLIISGVAMLSALNAYSKATLLLPRKKLTARFSPPNNSPACSTNWARACLTKIFRTLLPQFEHCMGYTEDMAGSPNSSYLERLRELLASHHTNKALYEAIVNAPFHNMVQATHLDMGIVVLLL